MTVHVSGAFVWGDTNNQAVPVADHRARLVAIDAAMTAAGLVRTSDTGQLDLAAAAVPAASSS